MNINRLKCRLIVTGMMLLICCTRNEDTIVIHGGGGSETEKKVVLSGQITENQTLSTDKVYIIKGVVRVKAGAELSIPAGTIIYADASGEAVAALIIEQGAKIDARGTAAEPIVFTSNKPVPRAGDWGGIVIVGKAKINRKGGKGTAELEELAYGGAEDADNSGILQYVRLEYTGHKFDAEHEYNAFSFYSVGSGTTVDHLQSYYGSDDGFEFFGGTVNVKYLVSTASADDSFDWTDGWRGKGQFLFAQQAETEGDRGIEADNLHHNPTATPISHPILSNVTLIGADDGGADNEGAHFRRGTQVTLVNSLITGFPKLGIEVESKESNKALKAGTTLISNNIIDNQSPFVFKRTDGTPYTGQLDLSDFDTYHNYTSTNLPEGLTVDKKSGFVTYGGKLAVKDPKTLDPSFFESVDYIGAIRDADHDWTRGWTRSL